MTQTHSNPSLETTTFSNESQIPLTHITVDDTSDTLLKKTALSPETLILLSAGFDKLDESVRLRLLQLIGRGIVRAAAEIGISFITRGCDSEINHILGQSVAERDQPLSIIGIAPADAIALSDATAPLLPLEPHHTHLLLVNTASWEKRTELLFRLIQTFLNQQIPIITLLINGDEHSRFEVLRSVRLRIPIIIVAGTGQLADELTTLYRNPPDFIPDPVLAEIIADGNIHLFPIEGPPADLGRLISRQLRGDNTLKLAWDIFGIYDTNAARHQRYFQRMQLWILGLGVLVTLLAILQKTIEHHTESLLLTRIQVERVTTTAPSIQQPQEMILPTPIDAGAKQTEQQVVTFTNNALNHLWQIITLPFKSLLKWAEPLMPSVIELLRYLIMAIPIIMTTLIAAINRFNAGKKWLNLRASAEQIKRQIFCYRAQAIDYSPQQIGNKTPETQLAEHLQNIAYNLMQTEVNVSALHPYPHAVHQYVAKGDDGMSPLTPERYLKARLEDQFLYYISKAKKLERRLMRLQWLVYIIGGVSTLLAALGLELWIALTTTIVTAIVSFVEYEQIEKNLMNVNQAATDLSNIRSWWIALSSVEQMKQSNIDLLVGRTERVLQGEFSSWVQEMQEALDALREKQTKESEGESTTTQKTVIQQKEQDSA